VVLIGVVVCFHISLETRLTRHRARKAIYEPRSIAHIMDMHRLTKDLERGGGARTPDEGALNPPIPPAELIRYPDSCSDLLPRSGMMAARGPAVGRSGNPFCR
jgi:hypothetical protein